MNKRIRLYAMLLLGVLLMPSCNKDADLIRRNFGASVEKLGNDDSKVQLSRERWTYWEVGDQISLCANGMSEPVTGDLIDVGGEDVFEDFRDYNGVFIATVPENSKSFLGLFPKRAGNTIVSAGENSENFTATINLPAIQPRSSDTSFANNVFPMVAWYSGEPYTESEDYKPAHLDFHSLAGLVRIQIFSSSTMTLDHLEITSRGNTTQLSGPFSVVDYKTFDPHLTPTAAGVADNRKITVQCSGTVIGPNELATFYIVLPATKSMNDSTNYQLTLDIVTTNNKHCARDFTARIRRNGINYMPALQITSWADVGGSGSGTTDQALVGNGTAERPFKVYSAADLVYLRNCYNSNAPTKTINGQPITANTHIHIMRSGIVMSDLDWGAGGGTEGIKNFVGIMEYHGANTSAPCIVNNSSEPLFKSISSQGHVSGLTMKYDRMGSGSLLFAPLCATNSGIIEDCHIVSGTAENGGITFSGVGIAGICATNNGTVRGCGNTASMSCPGRPIGGIVHTNNSTGLVEFCYTASEMTVTSSTPSNVGGIVYSNSGTVRDCYFASQITGSTSSWGGIVYTNSGRIEHCYTSETATLFSSNSVGGIVNTMTGGVVNYCWSNATLRGSNVGSLAATLSGGNIINSYCNNDMLIIAATAGSGHYAGGLVGTMSGGKLVNSYCYIHHLLHLDNNGILGGLVANITATAAGCIDNCYAYQHGNTTSNFYGNISTTDVLTRCYLVGASQEGTTSKTTGDLPTLHTTLNTNQSSITGFTGVDILREWQYADPIPVLTPYTLPPPTANY